MSELDEFKATYFDECSELLSELEEQFVAIEEGDHDPDRLNAVFRAIHSIKGGAGAFGFNQLVEFAHSFETMLDFVRDGRVEMSADVISLCIRSNDLVADFVAAARDGVQLDEGFGAEELALFKSHAGEEDETLEEFDIDFVPVMVNMGDETPAKPESLSGQDNVGQDNVGQDDMKSVQNQADPAKTDPEQDESDSFDSAPLQGNDLEEQGVWQIRFSPHSRLYERANDPLLLFRELMTLGEARICPQLVDIPNLANFEAFGVYCTWDITLKSNEVTEEAIREVFEFVEGDCDIEVSRITTDIDADLVGFHDETNAELVQVETGQAEAEEDAGAQELGEDKSAHPETGPEETIPEDENIVSFSDLAAAIEPKPAPKAETGPAPEANSPAANKKEPATSAANKPTAIQTIRVDLEKVDRVVNMVGELVITQSMLTQQMDDRLKAQYQELVRGVEVLAQTTRGLQDAVMAIRAQPVKSVFSRMPRLVRELNSKTGKKIRLEMVGEHTEIDKTIIEQLSDPLTHMIRNSADHGVEQPEKRIEAGKPEQGVIRLSAEQAGGNIIIAVEDDGAGINRERVLSLARERGVVGQDQQLTDEQIDELVFAPGFSTADAVSDISGRGVGMDVVISNIKKIGGSVHVRSSPGKGTRMQLRLPLTLAVLDVMLVEVGNVPYVIPLSSIVETLQTRRAEFGRAPSGRRVLKVRGEYLHVVDLAQRFEMNTDVDENERFAVLCEADSSTRLGIIVDKIIGQQQVVIKSLEENFRRIDGIAGGTILGDGNVALIVDVPGLNAPAEQKTAA
jgi:two-component system, chemotaxis family, sensor kinase CheA